MGFNKKKSDGLDGVIEIKRLNQMQATIKIVGTAPLVIHRFPEKAKRQMMDSMTTPKNQKGSKAPRELRDFDAEADEARHISSEGWDGFPAPGFRAAMIAACRTADLVMTNMKLTVKVIADGYDKDDGTPLVRIFSDKPFERTRMHVRVGKGSTDIHARPMWREWWANVTVEWDGDHMTLETVANLLDRAGHQVGIGEGRPFSKNSCGMGWGTFEVVTGDYDGK